MLAVSAPMVCGEVVVRETAAVVVDVRLLVRHVATRQLGEAFMLIWMIAVLYLLAIGITARCDGCLAFHAKAAKKHGATREEIIETIAVALYMGGGPSMIYGAEALSCFDALAD